MRRRGSPETGRPDRGSWRRTCPRAVPEGLQGEFVAGPEITPAVALAAVALFRVGTVLLGALVFFFAWRGEREAAGT